MSRIGAWSDAARTLLCLCLLSYSAESASGFVTNIVGERLERWGLSSPAQAPEAAGSRVESGFSLIALSSTLVEKNTNGTHTVQHNKNGTTIEPASRSSLRAKASDAAENTKTLRQVSLLSHIWGDLAHYISLFVCVKGLCIMSNVLTQFSPLPMVKQIKSQGNTGEFDALPFVMITVCGAQWCFYGFFAYEITGNRGFLVLVYANILGAGLGSFYTHVFHQNCRSAGGLEKIRRYYTFCAMVVLSQMVVAFVTRSAETALLMSGGVAATLSMVVTVSPLATLGKVVRDQSVDSMPVDLVLASFFSSILWLTCGVMLVDWWIIAPNAVGIVVGGFCVCLISRFRAGPSVAKLNDAGKETAEVALKQNSKRCLTTKGCPPSPELKASSKSETAPLVDGWSDNGCTGGTFAKA